MNLVLTVAEIVAPVFLLAGVGFVWVKLGIEFRIRFVTHLAMTLAVPCLIFTALMKTDIEPAALTAVSLASIAAYAVVTVILWMTLAALRLDRRTFLAPLIFGNTGNLGLPLALFAFGETGLAFAVVIFAIMLLISFTFGVWLVSGGGSVVKALTDPVAIATVLGALFLWQGWSTPRFLTNTLELIGQLTIPLMLITLGVALARLKPANLGQAFWLSLLKAAVCMGVAAGFGLWFDLAPIPFAVLVLQVGTPVAVTNYMLAEKYGADADAVAGLVVVSTLMSVALLPLLLAVVI
ncbi:AEC family transporter [Alphaproteobacteria bacterium GH1-50]|uniref:AEC family transporter n=1 Tax=Kangsaoukella pontilimi TaxID=2691042 RepID=A0A7C9MKI1_9RHOB|nr:AEC family transporter [Kangsaoukella pontilimi]MXQ08515.1 AEC family transporter [Kangsaoukella pontilimi]